MTIADPYNYPYALKIYRRGTDYAATVYKRDVEGNKEILSRLVSLSPPAFLAADMIVRAAIGQDAILPLFPSRTLHLLDKEWGAKLLSYAFVVKGRTKSDWLQKIAEQWYNADAVEARWWLEKILTPGYEKRVCRALRVLLDK